MGTSTPQIEHSTQKQRMFDVDVEDSEAPDDSI